MRFSQHLDKLGIVGSFLASCLCLGVPAIASLMSSLGLGFLANDAVLAPVLVAFLGLGIAGLVPGRRRHGSWLPLALALTGSVGVLVFTFAVHSRVLTYVAIAVMVVASVANAVLLRRGARHPEHAPPRKPAHV